MALKLPSLFSDHMVLQRAESVPFWGQAEPGEEIAVTLDGKTGRAQADAAGRWQLALDLKATGEGPFDLVIEGSRSGRTTVADVLVGEVWLGSGQSNMEWPLEKSLEAAAEIPRSANFRIREFHVEQTSRAEPQADVTGKWSVAGPDTAGAFSAVGYYFAKELEKTLQCPVGIVHSSWGGSRLEAWIAPEVLNAEETARAATEHGQLADGATARRDYVEQYRAWENRYGRRDPGTPAPASDAFTLPDASEAGWKPVTLPGKLADFGLPDAGVTWLRKKVVIPPAFARTGMHIHIDTFREFEACYLDGKLLRETTPESAHHILNSSRNFHMAPCLPNGEATFAIRLFSPAGGAEISGGSFKIEGAVPVDGAWLAKNETELPPLDPAARAAMPQPPCGTPALQNIPGALFNGMIAPLIPYAMAGVLWYQGESNVREANVYADGFRRMIEHWRAAWQLPTLRFLYCQLPNKGEKTAEPARSLWAEFQEVQAGSQSLPHVAMAVLMGLGDARDIHPRNKKDVGDRLARLALARNYGQAVPSQGPRYKRVIIEGDRIRIRFDHAQGDLGGLVAPTLPEQHVLRYSPDFVPEMAPLPQPSVGSPVQGFVICGADRKWKWAQAVIEQGDSVVVRHDGITHPVAVRYAWGDNPTCNLANPAGLPAMPFRTDNFPFEEA